MARFILLRLLHTILILFGVSIVAFSLIHLIPGNPLDILLPPEAPKEVVERLKVEFGFDKPLYLQYLCPGRASGVARFLARDDARHARGVQPRPSTRQGLLGHQHSGAQHAALL